MKHRLGPFLDELAALARGEAAAETPVRVWAQLDRDRFGGLLGVIDWIVRGRLAGHQHLLLFAPEPHAGDRPLLKVFVDRAEDLSAIAFGASAVAYGALEPGRAVAVAVGGELYYGSLPAESPSRRDPGWYVPPDPH